MHTHIQAYGLIGDVCICTRSKRETEKLTPQRKENPIECFVHSIYSMPTIVSGTKST